MTEKVRRLRVGFLVVAIWLGGCATAVDGVTTTAGLVADGASLSYRIVRGVVVGIGDIYQVMNGALSGLFGNPNDDTVDYQHLAGKWDERCIEAISEAAERTNVSPNYLVAVAMQESGCNPGAKSGTSSAAGMFQFIESTWLVTVKQHGKVYGLGADADAITIISGRPQVSPASKKRDILKKRFDPQLSAYMAAELAKGNQRYLEKQLNRKLTRTDLYMAHFLGPYGAYQLLNVRDERPSTNAALLMPTPAKANRWVFYKDKGRGKARTVDEMYRYFDDRLERALARAKGQPTA